MRPILPLAHLDVVEAPAEDGSPGLVPFTLTERDGYFYGRGTQDIKDGAAILATNFIRWKLEGWTPQRDIILALTADEERPDLENGLQWLLQHRRDLIDAEYAPQHRQRRFPVPQRRAVCRLAGRCGKDCSEPSVDSVEPR
jgi:acetylornithine deacetylase/succinyl-diaminopimelate desuccinylase-like protein